MRMAQLCGGPDITTRSMHTGLIAGSKQLQRTSAKICARGLSKSSKAPSPRSLKRRAKARPEKARAANVLSGHANTARLGTIQAGLPAGTQTA